MTYNVDYFTKEDVVYQLSLKSQSPVMHIVSIGPNNCSDSIKKQEVWDFYLGKCDNKILSMLMQMGEAYCYFLTENQAINAFYEWFPQDSDLDDTEKDYYIYARLINVSSGLDVVNGYEKV